MENQKQFVQFLIEAKKNTYAGGGDLSASSRPCSKDLTYQNGDYLYLDTYLGDLDFIGEEAVWQDGKPIWGMNYFGFMLTDGVPEEFGHFLKEALLRAPEKAPFRGPARFREGRFDYACHSEGNLDRFSGTEQISVDGRVIYRLTFHGGSIRSHEQ
ncbi:MAG TPA: DUF5680 domain-containing protein [Anaerolineaceae bacterium]|jgi:hypothetical protein